MLAQTRVTDDAKRNVALPAHVSRVFAAGAPAEVLLYTLVPDMLVGRNHMPTAAALDFMPPELRSPTPIKKLPDRDDPRYDDELLAVEARCLHRLRHDRRRLRRGARRDRQAARRCPR